MDNETSPADETVMARARADFARAREAMRQDRDAAAEDLRGRIIAALQLPSEPAVRPVAGTVRF